MLALAKGRYLARLARSEQDVARAQELRWRAFRAGPGGPAGRDRDAFDAPCRHLLVEELPTGRPVATFRLMTLASGGEIGLSYAARHYGLAGLATYPGAMAEVGRFCLDPGCHDPDALRIAWGALARIVLAEGVGMLFGCPSFPGTDAAAHRDALALLGERHLAPAGWRPQATAGKVVRFGPKPGQRPADPGRALRQMPPLLRSYLAMGGRVSDHAVIDDDLGTLHVFTGVEVAAIPPARARALQQIAG